MKAKIVLVERKIAPAGVPCVLCGKVAKEGQFVLVHTIPNVTHVVMHRKCLVETLEEIPLDLEQSIDAEFQQCRQYIVESMEDAIKTEC